MWCLPISVYTWEKEGYSRSSRNRRKLRTSWDILWQYWTCYVYGEQRWEYPLFEWSPIWQHAAAHSNHTRMHFCMASESCLLLCLYCACHNQTWLYAWLHWTGVLRMLSYPVVTLQQWWSNTWTMTYNPSKYIAYLLWLLGWWNTGLHRSNILYLKLLSTLALNINLTIHKLTRWDRVFSWSE